MDKFLINDGVSGAAVTAEVEAARYDFAHDFIRFFDSGGNTVYMIAKSQVHTIRREKSSAN